MARSNDKKVIKNLRINLARLTEKTDFRYSLLGKMNFKK